MKKSYYFFSVVLLAFSIIGCVSEEKEVKVIHTYEKTSEQELDKKFADEEQIIKVTYYELSDGTWKTDNHHYKYKLILTDRIRNATKESSYTILSNRETISFDEVVKASGFSSKMEDYFKEEDTIIVGIQIGEKL